MTILELIQTKVQSSMFHVQGSKDGGIAYLIVAIFVAKTIRHFWKGLRRAYA